jgi:hypothetical protein
MLANLLEEEEMASSEASPIIPCAPIIAREQEGSSA